MQVLRETPAEKRRRRRFGFFMWAGLAVALFVALAGCATAAKTACPVVTIDVVNTSVGQFYLLDAENLAKLALRMKGLEEQTCTGSDA